MNHLVVQFMLAGPKVGPDVGKASPVGLFIVVLLLIGVFLLVRSMNRHLKKVQQNFAPAAETPAVDTKAADTKAADTKADTETPHEPGG